MSNDCCPDKATESNAVRCPVSGSVGTAVDLQTVKALLTETALRRLKVTDYRFCPDPACRVVYFNADGPSFGAADIRVAVWQKEPFGVRTICYCFGESEATIKEEFEAAGRSRAAERVREHIAAGRCACEVRNPRGNCCLGDVIAAVIRVESAIGVRLDAEERSGIGNGTRTTADHR
jgi:hypothetical protein